MDKKESVYKQEWKIDKCGMEDYPCWCRVIILKSLKKFNYKDNNRDKVIVSTGAIPTKLACYIVKLHNKELKKQVNKIVKSTYKQKWKVIKCGVEDCGCRMIVLSSYSSKEDKIEDCIIPAGDIGIKFARYITKLHNAEIKNNFIEK